MAHSSNLPCNGDGICMICKKKSAEDETITCKTCVTPWHITCLSTPPQTLADTVQWECPDCSVIADPNLIDKPAAGSESSRNLIVAIRAIESDQSLTVQEKAKRRQQLMNGGPKNFSNFSGFNLEKFEFSLDSFLWIQPRENSNFSGFILTDFN
ncbi:hypothetical protein ACSBR1_011896 [Camellia fascicularis]